MALVEFIMIGKLFLKLMTKGVIIKQNMLKPNKSIIILYNNEIPRFNY